MNIVSIDFDIIMAPSIEFYNNLVSLKPSIFEDPLMQVCRADYIHYHRLTKWLNQKIKFLNKEDIIFIQSHEMINNYIQGEDITLYNIDHHHDLGYKEDNTIINCGNWALHLLKDKKIDKYIWINNQNSNKNLLEDIKFETQLLKEFNLNSLKPDKIIICLSPEWIPSQFHSLYYLWIDLVSQDKGYFYQMIENT